MIHASSKVIDPNLFIIYTNQFEDWSPLTLNDGNNILTSQMWYAELGKFIQTLLLIDGLMQGRRTGVTSSLH